MSLADTIAPEGDLERRLKELNIVRSSEHLVGFDDRFDWRRGGNETFIAAADAYVDSGSGELIRPFIAKAVVGFGTTKEKIENMLSNRKALEGAGAPVSELYSLEDSTFYERFLPEAVDPVRIVEANDPQVGDLIAYAAALDSLGYLPIRRQHNLFNELLSDGERAYAFDFGEDLGQPGATEDAHTGRDALEYVMKKAGTSQDLSESIMQRYQERLKKP